MATHVKRAEKEREEGEPAQLREALDRLYDAPPQEFTSLRRELAAELKRAGEPALAKRIAAARRPNRVAATLNRIVLHDAEAVSSVFEAFDAAAGEQMKGHVDAWKRALARYRERLGALAHAVRAEVASSGGSADAALLRGITEAVQAAAIDPDARARLLQGRMEKAIDAADPLAGLGAPPMPSRPGPPPPRPSPERAHLPAAQAKAAHAKTERVEREKAQRERVEREKAERERVERERAQRERAIEKQRALVAKARAVHAKAEAALARAQSEESETRSELEAADDALRSLTDDDDQGNGARPITRTERRVKRPTPAR